MYVRISTQVNKNKYKVNKNKVNKIKSNLKENNKLGVY